MTQYRILKRNAHYNWAYTVQQKLWGIFWITPFIQPYNFMDLEYVENYVKKLVKEEKEFAERKKIGDSVV